MGACCCVSHLLAYMVKAVVGSYLLQFPTLKLDTSVPAKTSFPAFTNKKSVGYVCNKCSDSQFPSQQGDQDVSKPVSWFLL